MKYDDLFEYVGEVGTYQTLVFLLCCLHSLWGVESIAMNFIGYTPDHWCKIPALADFTHAQQQDIGIPLGDNGEYSQCERYDLNFSSYSLEDLINWDRSSMVDNTTATTSCSDWVYDQTIFQSTLVSRYNLVCSSGFQNQLISTCFFAGVFVGAVLSGIISDRFGRKMTILVSAIFKFATGFLGVFAPNYPALVIGRFLLGLGTTGIFLTTYVLASELVGPRYRTLYGVGFQTAFSLGFMLIPGLAYAIRDDRMLQLAMHIPNVVFILLFVVLPESPRWLILKGKYKEAENVLQKMAKVNKRELPKDLDLSKLDGDSEKVEQKPCGDMMKYPRMRTRTCVIDFHWFVCSLMYYALSLNTESLSGDIFTNTVISGAVELPANLICFLTLNWRGMGRRLTCSLSLIIAGVSSFAMIATLLTGQTQGTTALSMIGKAFTTIGFSGIYVYSTEVFPTETRSSGMGTASMFARVSGMAAPYIGRPLSNIWLPMPSLIFGVFGTAAGLLCLALPETLGYKMFDTIKEAEAFNQKRAFVEPVNIEKEPLPLTVVDKTGNVNTGYVEDK